MRDKNSRILGKQSEIILDQLEEIIYVSDLNSYDLLFLNETGCSVFGISKEESVKQKCYEIFQGLHKPCPFCTNLKLSEVTMTTWECFNQKVNRHYLVKDKLIRWDDKKARLEMAIDITEKEYVSIDLQRKLDIEERIIDYVTDVENNYNLREVMQPLLKTVADYYQADECFIIEINKRKEMALKTYEWSAKNKKMSYDIPLPASMNEFPYWTKLLYSEGPIVITDVISLAKKYNMEDNYFKSKNIFNVYRYPFQLNNSTYGYMGIFNVRANQENLMMLSTMSYFAKSRISKRKLIDDLDRMNSILAVSPGSAYQLTAHAPYHILYANDRFYEVRGYTRAQVKKELNNNAIGFFHPDDLKEIENNLEELFSRKNSSTVFTTRVVCRDGSIRWALSGCGIIDGPEGETLNVIEYDITEQKEIEQELKISEERFRIALSHSKINVWEYDIVNKTILQMGDQSGEISIKQENVPESCLKTGYVHPETADAFIELYDKIRAGEKVARATVKVMTKSGEYRWVKMVYTNVFDKDGKPIRAIGLSEDISSQFETEAQYQRELVFRDEVTPDLIASYKVNLTKDIVENYKIERSKEKKLNYEYTYEQLLQDAADRAVSKEEKQRILRKLEYGRVLQNYRDGKPSVFAEYRRVDNKGRISWVCMIINLLKEPGTGDIIGFVYIRNIDEKKKLELALKERADKDYMTGMYSKETTEFMVEKLLGPHRQENEYCALFMVDLDNFKYINDSLGHVYGDKVLGDLANAMSSCFDSQAILGRVGGDEFVAFLDKIPSGQWVEDMAEKLCNVLNLSYLEDENHIHISGSAGIAVAKAKDMDYRTLFQQADSAMYEAKQSGKNGYKIYNPDEIKNHKRDRRVVVRQPFTEGEVEIQRITLQAVKTFQIKDDLIEALESILELVGNYYQAQRTYYIEKGNNKGREEVLRVCEWCKEGEESKADIVNALRWEQIPEFFHHGSSGNSVPITSDSREIGYLCVERPKKYKRNMTLLYELVPFISCEVIRQSLKKHQEYLSYHDDLTGLYNRNSYILFLSQLEEEVLSSLGVISVDINGLKRLNQDFGHFYGDQMVRKVAEVLQKCCQNSRVFRLAGDEFLVFTQDIAYHTFVEQIQAAKNHLNRDGRELATFGFVWEKTNINVDVMVARSDELMRIEKQEYYQRSDDISKYHQPAIRDELLQSLKKGEYCIYLQPKADCNTGKIVGAEALIRRIDPDEGVIAPGKFIPLLEKNNLIHYIDLFVFRQVCATLKRWKEEGRPLIRISLNFSRSTMLQENLVTTMLNIQKEYEISSEFLEIEITESMGEMNQETLAVISGRIRKAHFRISLDDFGSKFSSLSIVSTMDFDVLKLDKSLVDDIVMNQKCQLIACHTVTLCKEMGIEIIAEGVETKEQWDMLRSITCDQVQGYLINKPLPVETFEKKYIDYSQV